MEETMNVCIYSPYLSTGVMGGGEKHILEFGRVVAEKHTVSIALTATVSSTEFQKQVVLIKERLDAFLGWSTNIFSFIQSPIGSDVNFLKKIVWTHQFDYLYAVTDGSLFFSAAKRSNLHIQLPFTNDLSSFFNQLKLKTWQQKNANSIFTKDVVETSWKTHIDFVHYPLIRQSEFAGREQRQNIILSVGRFFKQLHSKRQDVLIQCFAEFIRTQPKTTDWKLLLVGPVEDAKYLSSLRRQAQGLPVEFLHSVPREQLVRLYKTARLYWHAAGYEQDPMKHPQQVEHFGISVVEAMAAGAIPVVVGTGGPKEILSNELTELCWQSVSECVSISKRVLSSSETESRFRKLCALRARDFSEEVFEKGVWQMLQNKPA